MKIQMMFLTLLLSTLCVAFTYTSTSSKIKVDKLEHDFGIIAQGNPSSATFTLTNHAYQPLVLEKVMGSCGCTATSYESEPIAPGAKTQIEATYNAKSVGKFTKTVSVYTNLIDEPIVLTLKGIVETEK